MSDTPPDWVAILIVVLVAVVLVVVALIVVIVRASRASTTRAGQGIWAAGGGDSGAADVWSLPGQRTWFGAN